MLGIELKNDADMDAIVPRVENNSELMAEVRSRAEVACDSVLNP